MGKAVISYLLDTNAIVRWLVRDEESQYQQVTIWFKDAQAGKMKIIVPTITVAESCFVLQSFYKKRREEIGDAMVVFLSQRWLVVPDREVLLSLWEDFNQGWHFVDSFLLAYSRQNKVRILSFDRKLLKRSQTVS